MYSSSFSFYNVNILIKSSSENIIGDIQRDFSFFKSKKSEGQITLTTYNSIPPYNTLPAIQSSYISPRNICYFHQGIKYIEYSGKALVVYDKHNYKCDIYSPNHSLLHEIIYMTILSLVNELLEKKHIHRVHGLGLNIKDKAILILLGMGGGKSTLAMKLLSSHNPIGLISEDSPLIDAKGKILPFPIRIGIHPQDVPAEIPKEYQRSFERQEFEPKVLIDIEYFKNKICNFPCRPHIIIIGKRVLGREPEIKAGSRVQAFNEFFRNSVVGLGLYQGIEYVFQKGPGEILKKVPLAFSRLNNALKVVNHSKIFEFFLSPDKDRNTQVLVDFLRE